jgi:DNA-binding GntR family transcriptional regulator
VTGRRVDLFDALAQPLRERIRAGELLPGSLLPSEAELALAAGTKRYSVRRALALLQEEGLIDPIAGRGWIVVDRCAAASGAVDVLPRYRQIAAELRAAIEGGRLLAGSALPSEADLTARHEVSRATVRQALAVLESEGLINTYPGKGRYVRVR